MTAFLIADDSPGKLAFLHAVVTGARWPGPVLTAATTEEAIAIVADADIVAAFVDYEIPSENGPAIVRALREKNDAIRIAVVSASDRREYQESAREAGAHAYVCTSHPQDAVIGRLIALLEEWTPEASEGPAASCPAA